eukprot:TRINITY_DN22288_c0_g1_i1.p1 TRINITY_DN22288_c0_g1~~TRINITY_DN22288_c0_g1_i1.p1  ORF type:complete len:630 (+),score=99.42 TRINITY_DN22288_c0_g1_i1:37-1890(+)
MADGGHGTSAGSKVGEKRQAADGGAEADKEEDGFTIVGAPKRKKAKTAQVAVELVAGKHQPTLADIQNLLLRVFTTEFGDNPRWLNVRGMGLIRSCHVAMLPCLDRATVQSNAAAAPVLAQLLESSGTITMRSSSEIEFFPRDQRAPDASSRLLRSLLSAKSKPAVTCKKPAKANLSEAKAKKLPISTYLASAEERGRSGYPDASFRSRDGWVSTAGVVKTRNAEGTGERKEQEDGSQVDPDLANLVALDCEMVMTASGHALARVSLVSHDGSVLYDSLVQPTEAVTDYLTKFSGITESMLVDVLVTISDVQARLLELISEETILVGHSLESDLCALKLVHERVIDTALIYPHPKGWPYRHGLAGLCSSLLKRKMDRSNGHDSIEDSKIALELVLMKFEKGPEFGVTGGTSAPLGRILQSGKVDLLLMDLDSDASSSKGSKPVATPWHETNCKRVSAEEDASDSEAKQEKAQRSVHFTLMHGFEELCKQAALESVGLGSSDALRACLSRIDSKVADIALKLAPDELLVILNGCGDFHEFQRVEENGTVEQQKLARKKFKDAWGFLMIGGPKLWSLVVGAAATLAARASKQAAAQAPRKHKAAAAPQNAAREIVTYDL